MEIIEFEHFGIRTKDQVHATRYQIQQLYTVNLHLLRMKCSYYTQQGNKGRPHLIIFRSNGRTCPKKSKTMIESVVKQWDANKHKLKEYFETTKQANYADYKTILIKLFELVITEVKDQEGYITNFDISRMTVIDDGQYEGTMIYIIPTHKYQPTLMDYVITDNYYGTCSGCDTLLSIYERGDVLAREEQVKGYMTIALHLVQKMRWLERNEF